jgi:hypothetical protein
MISLTNEFRIAIALLEMPVSSCTMFSSRFSSFRPQVYMTTHLYKYKKSIILANLVALLGMITSGCHGFRLGGLLCGLGALS